MKQKLIYGGVFVLLVLHQDAWFWDDPSLVAGVVPIGLAYHVFLSVLAAGFWAFACFRCWPDFDEGDG